MIIKTLIFTILLAMGSLFFWQPSLWAMRYIYTSDPHWTADVREDISGTNKTPEIPSAAITAANPRSGNASLALTTSGELGDWSFFTRFAGGVSQPWGPLPPEVQVDPWGALADISGLSFDWYRATQTDYINYDSQDPWNFQTPALRLLVKDGTNFSELVWEGYYSGNTDFEIGAWVAQDLADQYFWRHTITVEGYTTPHGDVDPFEENHVLLAMSLGEWSDQTHTYYEDPYVYGLSVGVGSNWPGEYLGFVDNVYLSFSSMGDVLCDNFELPRPIPEPATFYLLSTVTGILAIRRKFTSAYDPNRLFGRSKQAS